MYCGLIQLLVSHWINSYPSIFQKSAIALIIIPGPDINLSADSTVGLRVVFKARIFFIHRPYAGYLDITKAQLTPFPNSAII